MSLGLILGSSSVWRRRLVESWGLQAALMSPDIDEKSIRDQDPKKMVLKIARGKRDALISNINSPSVLITCDQVILCNGAVREKPETANECREYLRSYRTYPAIAIVGVVVTNTLTEGVAEASAYFREIPDSLIESLIEQGDVMTCAGGFVIEEMTDYIDRIEGEPSTVQGISKDLTLRLLQEVGYKIQ